MWTVSIIEQGVREKKVKKKTKQKNEKIEE